MPVPQLPDPLDLTVRALLAQPVVTALVGTRISDRIPGDPTWPLIAAATVDDDEDTDPAIGAARVQVNCWAGLGPAGAAAALQVARAVRSVARDLAGVYPPGVIVACAPAAIIPAPDQVTGRGRAIIDLLLETHA